MLPAMRATAAPTIIGIPKPSNIPAVKVDLCWFHHALPLNFSMIFAIIEPSKMVNDEGMGRVAPKTMLTAETGTFSI